MGCFLSVTNGIRAVTIGSKDGMDGEIWDEWYMYGSAQKWIGMPIILGVWQQCFFPGFWKSG